jgi:hypothetical protein
MESNKDEAAHTLQRARSALRMNEAEKAMRLARLSCKLHATPEAEGLSVTCTTVLGSSPDGLATLCIERLVHRASNVLYRSWTCLFSILLFDCVGEVFRQRSTGVLPNPSLISDVIPALAHSLNLVVQLAHSYPLCVYY